MPDRTGQRAPALPPDERRLTILQTAARMARRDQEMPSTRRLAGECGIAEGTVFRAFATKDELVEALISFVACPQPFRHSLMALPTESVPTREGLRQVLLQVAVLLQERFAFILSTLGPIGLAGPPRHGPHPGCPLPGELDPQAFRAAVGRVLAPYGSHLRVDPDLLIDALRHLAFAGCHEGIRHGLTISPQQVVDLLLDGALTEPDPHPACLRSGDALEKEVRC